MEKIIRLAFAQINLFISKVKRLFDSFRVWYAFWGLQKVSSGLNDSFRQMGEATLKAGQSFDSLATALKKIDSLEGADGSR